MDARERGMVAAADAAMALMNGLSRAERPAAASALACLGLELLCDLEGREFVRGYLAAALAEYSHGGASAAAGPARRM